MANLLVLVLDDVEHCPSILDAWNKAGVMGITILESTGQARLRRAGALQDCLLYTSPSPRDS